MHRSFLPFLLVSLGYAIALLATTMPLFEWQISEVVTDFPSTYEVHVHPSPWTARLGDSLDHGLYITFGQLYVSKDGENCRYNMNIVVKRSWIERTLEQLSQSLDGFIAWLYEWNCIEIVLSVVYVWWFTIWYKRPVGEAFVFTIIAGLFNFELTQILRELLPRVIPFASVGTLDCYHGIVTFAARLSKVHYETLFVFGAGILAQLGAFGMMLGQIIKATIERKESPKLVAG